MITLDSKGPKTDYEILEQPLRLAPPGQSYAGSRKICAKLPEVIVVNIPQFLKSVNLTS